MKISLNWVKNYIDLSGISVQEIADKITYAGLEVEEVEDQAKDFENLVVGFVKERVKHPNADKLSKCIVTDGVKDYNVVCGAPNVAAGQKVVFAKIGAIIPNGKFKIEKAKIRGEVSEGMICSERELGISESHEGILVLPESAKEGTNISDALEMNDVLLEVAITPNRADALSHLGIARELSALFNIPVKYPEVKFDESGKKSEELAAVEIKDAKNCPRYIGKVVTGVTIKESPEWLKKKLTSIGLRPINNVVDVTNFVLHEVGQPLHAFDLDNLKGKKIIVKLADKGEKFTTLDSKERALKETDLMICDGEKSVAIAGVMGGENSEVTSATKNILIESAFFNPSSVRKTAKHLALSTDASYRFERGADYNITLWAAKRTAQLIQETAGGTIAVGEIDAYPNLIEAKKTELRFASITKILGYVITNEDVKSILTNLGFKILEENNEKLTVQIPSYRHDVEREIDLIEEVARIYGYNKIPEVAKISVTLEPKVDHSSFADKSRNVLNSLGFYEIITNSLLTESIGAKFAAPIKILNPQSSEMSHLRTSLIPGLLTSISNNLKVNEKNLCLFELGKTFNKKNEQIKSFDDFEENEILAFAVTGNMVNTAWYEKDRKADIHDLIGIVDSYLQTMLPNISYSWKSQTDELNNYSNILELYIEGKSVGKLGKLDDKITSLFDINQNVFICELDLQSLKKIIIPKRDFKELLKYPKVYRDIAFVLNAQIEVGAVIEVIKESCTNLLHNVELFDIFQSESLGEGNKSIAFQLEFFNEKRTLTEEEIEKDFRSAIKAVEQKFNAQLRGN